ncbi:uncharacterized protein DNG_05495 [Cephalotrichum gorgonifer]|uniref:Uncharacterized protein n=1 Tax=Cephalotrichum gorgonifer TaxID=2041049 RepID=A0AAE8SVI4_9PEZI|nr:uncharacterized protein DNG_05495 [Cephalotrichum gorgonifer]
MADPTLSIAEITRRLQESRPPATDTFTYLTVIEQYMSPEILPALHDILQDAALTKDIGWDLVEMLIDVPGGEACLEAVARLGNPREVILKVLEVLERPVAEAGEEEEEEDEVSPTPASSAHLNARFITLVGMLGILHKRLEVRAPSKFVHATLHTVLGAYMPTPESTAAVITLVRDLSSSARPPLPSRKSSTTLTTPFASSDPAMSAPDPEAEKADPVEDGLVTKLLQAFITCVIAAYVDANDLAWAARLVEYYNPERIVPGRKTVMESFREEQELLARDALIGQLAALAGDLGLAGLAPEKITQLVEAPLCLRPLAAELDPERPDGIKLSSTGFWCLAAYWVFSSEVFGSPYTSPDMHIFPDHSALLHRYLGDEGQAKIVSNPGVVDAILVLGLWLHRGGKLVGDGASPDFMAYHHSLTLCAVFHPSLSTRNAATTLAGLVLHDDPDDADRLRILDDLLENCIFPNLQACAVAWLREEIVLAARGKLDNRFASPECVESLQYSLFPNLDFLGKQDAPALAEYWLQNEPYHLQVANFAYLLFAGETFRHLVPAGMTAAVEERYVKPLLEAGRKLLEAAGGDEQKPELELPGGVAVLVDRLASLPL